MASRTKTFRVFVSSTFTDLRAERNALQKYVFPRLRELCARHGCRFQAIDLRWGVRDEAALDHRAMTICLEEIARCQKSTPRPNFIVLLGDRYGWCPLPPGIPALEFADFERQTPAADRALLKRWYVRDDNAVPPVYRLLPRTGEFVDAGRWGPVERRLHSLLTTAAQALDLPADRRWRYTASATEQEVIHGALQVADARDHVFGFFRTIRPVPSGPRAPLYLDVDQAGKTNAADHKLSESLKSRLRSVLDGSIFEYEAAWSDTGITTTHLAQLCRDVYRSLAQVILKEVARIQQQDELERETAEHLAFGRDRSRSFVGRSGVLERIAEYVRASDPHPLGVYGDSGSGKSALLARAADLCLARSGAEVVVRFIGATPESSDGEALLAGLCREISRRYGADEKSVPATFRELRDEFSRRLALARTDRPLVVFLDALDQLSAAGHARNLAWLPARLPASVRLIVSTLPGKCLTAVQARLPAANLVELPRLASAEAATLLDRWLREAGRTLQPAQRQAVLSKASACGLPLYLRLAFEQARQWTSDRAPPALPADVTGVIHGLLDQLSAEANHGPLLVARSLGYLAAARNGLSEDELLDLLSLDPELLEDFLARSHHPLPEKKLPVVVWSRLYFDLQPYLAERSADGTSLFAFFHRQVGEVVAERYLSAGRARAYHRHLAAYFAAQPLSAGQGGSETGNLRKFSELPFQQTHGALWPELERTLGDLQFVEAKCGAGMTSDLLEDYGRGVEAVPDPQRKKSLDEFHAFLTAEAHVLRAAPRLTFQQAANQPDGSAPSQVAATAQAPGPWLRWLNKPPRRPSCLVTFGAESDQNACAALDPAGRCIALAQGSLVRIFAITSGLPESEFDTDGRTVTACCFTADGAGLFCGHEDGMVTWWDITHAQSKAELAGHKEPVSAVCAARDRLVSAAADGTARIWELPAAQCVGLINSLEPRVCSCALHPSRPWLLLGGVDGQFELWDLAMRTCLGRMRGAHTATDVASEFLVKYRDKIADCSFSADGRYVAVAQADRRAGALYVLEVTESGVAERLSWISSPAQRSFLNRPTEGHGGIWCASVWGSPPRAIATDAGGAIIEFSPESEGNWRLHAISRAHSHRCVLCRQTPDGERVVTVDERGTGRVWATETLPQDAAVVAGPLVTVLNGAASPSGKEVVVCREDGLLAIWEVDTRRYTRLFDAMAGYYDHPRRCAAWTPDGRFILSGGEEDFKVDVFAASGSPAGPFGDYRGFVSDCAVSPSGAYFATVSEDGSVNVVGAEGRQQLQSLRRQGRYPRACCFGQPEQLVATVWNDGVVALWNWRENRLTWSAQAHEGPAHDCAFHPALGTVITAGEDGTVKWWTPGAAAAQAVAPMGKPVRGCRPSPCGRWLVTWAADVAVFDLASSTALGTMPCGKAVVFADFVAPPGGICIGSADGDIRLVQLMQAVPGNSRAVGAS